MSDKANGNKFYCVVRDEHHTVINYRHATINSAYAEAVRLAKQENKPFFVMQTALRIEPRVIINDVQIVMPDDITDESADCRPGEEWKRDCENQLRNEGFTQDPSTGTWSKSF